MSDSRMLRTLAVQMQMIDKLRVDEGSSVTLYSPNPDVSSTGEPAAVGVYGWWTNWREKKYAGVSVTGCLTEALKEKEEILESHHDVSG